MITATLVSAPHGMDVNEHQDAHEISVVVDTTDPGCRYQTRASHHTPNARTKSLTRSRNAHI